MYSSNSYSTVDDENGKAEVPKTKTNDQAGFKDNGNNLSGGESIKVQEQPSNGLFDVVL